jgi:hypothetical protein
MPLHLAPRCADGTPLVVRRKPGRPKLVRPAPTASEEEYIEQINIARDHHVDGDPLVASLRGGEEIGQVLRAVIDGLARESASLGWEIRQGHQAGRDVSQLCSRRIDALSKIGLVQLGLRRLGAGDELTPSDARMNVIVDFFMKTVSGVLTATLPPELAGNLRELIDGRLLEWQTGQDGPLSSRPR